MLGHIRNRRGAGMLGCLLMLALLGAGIYAGLQIGLPKLRNTSFEDRLSELAEYFRRQPEEYIRKRIIETAADFDIALKPEQVKIRIEGDHLEYDLAYEKFVDLKVWQRTYTFTIHRSGPY